MREQSHPSGAVFLSYASQDAPAAERICEALRAAGVEVWLDKNELRGGDTWDAQIKKHIHDCALFIPIISAHTNARSEGYFRREWKQATRRLQDMADDVAFLVPVVIDETREADARVPEEFLQAQWTWLPGGETPPAFATRVRQLVGLDSAPAPTHKSAATGVINQSARSPGSVRPSPVRRYGLPLIALLILGAGVFWYFQGASDAPAAKVAPITAPSVTAPAPNDKSIAVLPFVNMSSDAENEYFADGLSEELLNLLTKIPELRVAARTSAFRFKGAKVDVQDVARKLNVAHVLEGSVRQSGDTVRITVQLVKAADGYHLWSETYDRTLSDIFAVQDEIAGAVVNALHVPLLGIASAARSKPTDSEAYKFALQARYFLGRRGREDLARSIKYFRESRDRDPGYAPAWAGLSLAYAWQADAGFAPVTVGYSLAREAAEKALVLDPQLVEGHLAMGWILSNYDWNWAEADASYRRALELEPGNAQALRAVGLQAMVFGRWDEALAATKQAIERDPLQPNYYNSLGLILEAINRDREAEVNYRKALELDVDGAGRHMVIGRSLLLQGKLKAALSELKQEKSEGFRLAGLPLVYYALGRRRESDEALATLKKKYAGDMAFQIAEVHAFRGEADAAFEWLNRAYDQHDGGISENIKGGRLFRTLINDPRFKAFLKRLQLPE